MPIDFPFTEAPGEEVRAGGNNTGALISSVFQLCLHMSFSNERVNSQKQEHYILITQRISAANLLAHSNCSQQPGQGQAKAKSWEFNLGLPLQSWGIKYLAYHLLRLLVHNPRKIDQKQSRQDLNQAL